MALKQIVKTKTFWGGLATVLTGIGMVVMGDKDPGIQTIIGGILAIFIRDAVQKSGPREGE